MKLKLSIILIFMNQILISPMWEVLMTSHSVRVYRHAHLKKKKKSGFQWP